MLFFSFQGSSMRRLLGMSMLATGLLASTAHAGNAYVGAGMGKTKYDYSSGECTKFANANSVSGTCAVNTGDLGLNVYGGYNLNSYLGAEFAYTSLSSAGLVMDNDSTTGSIGASAFSLKAVATAPLDDKLSFFAAIGMYSAKSDLSVFDDTTKTSLSDNASGTGTTFSIGGRYAFSQAVSIRAEYQRFSEIELPVDKKSNVDLIAIGFLFSFL